MDRFDGLLGPTVMAAALAAIPALLGLWAGRRDAGTREQREYYNDLREDLERLERRLDRLQSYLVTLENYVDDLRADMLTAGMKPKPRPERPILE